MASSANDILVNLRFNYSEVNKAVNKINNSFKKLDGVASTVKKQQVEVSKMTQSLNNLGLAGNSVGGIFGKLFAKVGVWLGVTTVVYSLLRGFTAVLGEVKALEDANIRLQRVMQGSDDTIKQNTKNIYKFADSMNRLTSTSYKDIIDSTAEAVKAGFSFTESLSITRAALLAKNVAEIDSERATTFLISTIRQFNMSALDSMDILDKWNELGQRTGATSIGIADAVSRAGKAFKSVGGDLSQLTGFVAATIEGTGESGEKIGTFFKTISARYADLERRSSLRSKLDLIGIELYDKQSGKFRNMITVFGELAQKWDKLTDAQKSSIGKAAAGVRQYSRFLSVIENFDDAIRATAISINSMGSAIEENEKRMNSLSFSIGLFQGQVSKTASGPVGTFFLNLMKWGTEVGTVVVYGINKLTEALANLNKSSNNETLKNINNFMDKFNILLHLINLISKGHKSIIDELKKFNVDDLVMETTSQKLNQQQALLNSAEAFIKQYKSSKSFFTQNEILKSFQTVSPELAKMLLDVTSLKEGSKGWNDGVLKIKTTLEQMTNPSNQVKTIFNDISKTMDTKFVKDFEQYGNSIIKMFSNKKTSNEVNKVIINLQKLSEEYNQLKAGLKKGEEDQLVNFLTKDVGLSGVTLQNYEDVANLYFTYARLLKVVPETLEMLNDKSYYQSEEFVNSQAKIMEKWFKLQKQNALDYYDDILKANKDSLKAISDYQKQVMDDNKNFMQSIVDEVFSLKEGQTLADNLTNAMVAFGNNLYDITKNSIVQGIVDGMQMKEVYEELGRSIKTTTTDLFKGFNGFFDSLNSMGDTWEIKKEFLGLDDAGLPQTYVYDELTKGIQWGDLLKTGLGGMGLGAMSASMTGRDTGSGMLGGSIGALIGNMLLPGLGGVLGGALGGLFGAQKPDENKDVDESLKYQRESTKELKEVNRNLVLMRQDLRPWEYISDSYFFSQATNRGFVGA